MANKIDKNIDVTIASNLRMSYSFDNKRGIAFDLDEYGDEEVLTFEELKKISTSKYKNVLRNMFLVITDVDSDEFTVDDVVKQLKLDKYYDTAKKVLGTDEVQLDSFEEFVTECSNDELAKAIKHDNLSEVLTETAVALWKEKEIDETKLKVVLTPVGIDNLYEFISDISSL
ncbi:hypothetical protein JXA27_07000 [Aerococcaceae bacterium zg-B36]|uniref:hypothetical protein n=1 Tax=Aerococcaceae bacterium zg-252 TaxID=2796928 RepID=UPI001BD8201F|nr:hypothetical protein [Aerococcaceae bacterium zg-B36]